MPNKQINSSILNLLAIDEYSSTPKYKQIYNSITNAIDEKKLKKGDFLPSINDLYFNLDIGRETVEKAYNTLKNDGIIESKQGKGFFIVNDNVKSNKRICLLFNKLSDYKKEIYDAFIKEIGEDAIIDFYIYNNDFAIFKKMLENSKKDYTHYILIPHFIDVYNENEVADVINSLNNKSLILMDKLLKGVKGDFSAVYEDFKNDIYDALIKVLKPLSKYRTLKLIFPDDGYYPKEIIEGFRLFCLQYAFDYRILNNIENDVVEDGDVLISLKEEDLISSLEKTNGLKKKIGKQVGIISYNETAIKRILLNGITTISTDFTKMGSYAAEIIKSNIKVKKRVPFNVYLRNSL
ncbi:GntR family transcriptional regulator [Pedobacter puniceum]|uniref:GntR family transcriptional regulator n=1 Tax=Pedobacter puniceum TaxID=2666136 RepID=A0A7K0FTI6_9SPHI|nr:GntR family transcriptional regulator [Pedobacter puniceum]MRX48795.1 GntR family transcriptional regulator [Pedobacter puniceum]